MKPRNSLLAMSRRPVVRPSLITVAVGVFLVSLSPFHWLSYDVSYVARPRVAITNVVLVLFDDTTLKELGSENNELNRTNHARLLERLAGEQDKPKLVFYDVVFAEPRATDQKLAHAIEEQGSVILAAKCDDTEVNGNTMQTPTKPLGLLRKVAKGWGHTELLGPPVSPVREISWDLCDAPYAVWVAATNLQPRKFFKADPSLFPCLNYYGPPGSEPIPRKRFEDALITNGPTAVPVGFFKDKIVFVGEREGTLGKISSRRESFTTPYSFFGYHSMAGVEIHATALLNLLRDDWLRPTTPIWQCGGALLWGIAMPFTLYSLSRQPKVILFITALAAAALLAFVSLYCQWHLFRWWCWMGPAFGQTATALVLVLRCPKREPYIAFISYRTEEDGAAALLISRSLAERGLKTFLDVRSLESGKFDEQLLNEIENSTFFIPILSQRCLTRCKDPNDWVLREITHALALRKVIIPVMRAGFSFGPGTDVPDLPQLTELSRYHGVQYSNADFEGFLDQLIARLKGSDRAAEKVLN